MEQKEKIEKPKWVQTVEILPEIVRQPVGSTAAGIISSLVQLWLLSPQLYNDVIVEANGTIYRYSGVEIDPENFVNDTVNDVKSENV